MTFGSLFAGVGGIDLGLERAGWGCKFQIELDPFCQRVLAKHWPNVPRFGDIRKVTGDELPDVDFLVGGYPCQPFSQAGKRGGAADPRHLWLEFARLIRILRPRGVLLENVPGHLSLGFGEVLGDLAGLGFNAEWLCLRASDFGASHLRKRVFVVAYRDGVQREQPARIGAGSREKESGRPCSESSGRSEHVANAARDARNGSHGQDGARRGVCETGNGLGDAKRARRTAAGLGCDLDAGSELKAGCRDMADTGDGQLSQPRRGSQGRDGPGSASQSNVPDSRGEGLPDTRQGVIEGPPRKFERPIAGEICGTFAPGPSDPRWPDILAQRPDLAPALESPVRGMADGIPALMDRTKRLKALGNAVVPQVAQWIGERILQVYKPSGTRGNA